jgi:lipopolysaccharide biosynthesis regulator YciM
MGDPVTAERHYRKALEVARAQQAGSPELRAAVELADLYCDIGQRDEARQLLAPWRDGAGDERISAELRRARAMLMELT